MNANLLLLAGNSLNSWTRRQLPSSSHAALRNRCTPHVLVDTRQEVCLAYGKPADGGNLRGAKYRTIQPVPVNHQTFTVG